MPACLPFLANSYGGWGEGHRVVGDVKEKMPLGSPKLPLKQEGQQKNAVAPRIMGRGRESLPGAQSVGRVRDFAIELEDPGWWSPLPPPRLY